MLVESLPMRIPICQHRSMLSTLISLNCTPTSSLHEELLSDVTCYTQEQQDPRTSIHANTPNTKFIFGFGSILSCATPAVLPTRQYTVLSFSCTSQTSVTLIEFRLRFVSIQRDKYTASATPTSPGGCGTRCARI